MTTQTPAEIALQHSVWVWRFDVDGDPQDVLNKARSAGTGIILKTHDGADWMGTYDKSPTAINGPLEVRQMADMFESQGVPFHAWCVVQGEDPIREAQICSDVLNNGARTMIFDLEPSDGGSYWQGTDDAALQFGRELRRLQPHAYLSVAPDARPWQIDAVPTTQFASFCDAILPQAYWETFDSPANYRFINRLGYNVGPDGVTPELILDMTADKLAPLGLPIRPIGQGAADGAEWQRFIAHAYSRQMDSVSVWRFGTASDDVWPTLHAMAPPPLVITQAKAPVAPPAVAPAVQKLNAAPPPTFVVEKGESASKCDTK